MASEDQVNKKELERKRVLEEIRKRAEEAELQRLEQEERQSVSRERTVKSVAPAGTFTRPKPVGDQKIRELRERLVIAVDRGKTEKASALLEELRDLVFDDPMIGEFEARISELQQEQQRVKGRRRAAELKATEEATQLRAQREAKEKKISELIQSADSFYQRENYQKAIEYLEEAHALDPENEKITGFRTNIERARQLADRIKEEEARRRAEEAVTEPPPEPVHTQPVIKSERDVWGSTEMTETESVFEIVSEEKAPIVPQKPPLIDRLVARAYLVRFPVKTIIVSGLIVAAGVGYIIIDSIRHAVFPPKYSLLVFPAPVAPGDSATQSFVEGFADDLIQDLARVQKLRVLSASTSLQLKDVQGNPSQLSRTLGANFFLRWTLSKTSESALLNLSLYDTLSVRPIYVSRYKTSVRELPALRREVARALLDTMHIELTPEVEAEFARLPSANARAYEAYLRGLYFLMRQDEYPLSAAADAFQLALRADSSFGDAQAGLGWTHILAYETDVDTSQTRIARASMAVQLAMAHGSMSSTVFRIWGMVDFYRAQFDRALQRLQQAVSIAPSDAESQRRLAVIYATKGRLEDALRAAELAVASDPRNIRSHTTLGLIQQFTGDYKAALQSYEHGLRYATDPSEYGSAAYADVLVFLQREDRAVLILNERIARDRTSYVDYYKLGRVYQSSGKPIQLWDNTLHRAKELIQERLSRAPNDAVALTYLALVETRLGKFKEAVTASKRAYEIAPDNYEVLYNIARVHAVHQDKSGALEYLKRAMDRRYCLDRLVDMDFFNIRRDEDFLGLVTR